MKVQYTLLKLSVVEVESGLKKRLKVKVPQICTLKNSALVNLLSVLSLLWSVLQVDKEALDIQVIEKKKQEEAAREEQNAHGELAKCGFLTYVTSI